MESVLSDYDDKEIMAKVTYFVECDNPTLKYEAEFC